MAFCTNCGAQVADTSKFCVNCGTPMGAAAASGGQYAPPAPAPLLPLNTTWKAITFRLRVCIYSRARKSMRKPAR